MTKDLEQKFIEKPSKALTAFFSSPNDLKRICSNPFHRYDKEAPPAAKKAYILISEEGNSKHWAQFNTLETLDPTQFRPIQKVSPLNNNKLIRATSPGGTIFEGDPHRAIKMTSANFTGWVQPLSPSRSRKHYKTSAPQFSTEQSNLQKMKGKSFTITAAALRKSARKKSSGKSTRDVMKQSATEACQQYIQKNQENLPPKTLNFFHRLEKDFEWLHALAKSLVPSLHVSQHSDNLAAAHADENTRMMIMEKFARVFARHPNMTVTITPQFTLLPNSDIIHTIDYTLTIKHQDNPAIDAKQVTLFTHSDALQEKESPRSTDKLMISVAYDLLQNKPFSRLGLFDTIEANSTNKIQNQIDLIRTKLNNL